MVIKNEAGLATVLLRAHLISSNSNDNEESLRKFTFFCIALAKRTLHHLLVHTDISTDFVKWHLMLW